MPQTAFLSSMEPKLILNERMAFSRLEVDTFQSFLFNENPGSEENPESPGELNISFEYQCHPVQREITASVDISNYKMRMRNSSFSCLSGAALSANATLANTNMCNGRIGEEILPSLDSPKSFRRLESSPSLSRLDSVMSSSQNSMSDSSVSNHSDTPECGKQFWEAMDLQMAGGAAGEDRVQVVCSEENGWLFCAVYDGFNGRDAADFLAGTLYENIGFYLGLLESRRNSQFVQKNSSLCHDKLDLDDEKKLIGIQHSTSDEYLNESFQQGIVDSIRRALSQSESDFMHMVEQEMEERPDLVSVGSCVLAAFLHDNDLYILNLGDSRAVLATSDNDGKLRAVQLTEIHSLENEIEREKLIADHPDDPSPIMWGRVKGKLKVTRAFGVGYLKKRNMNDALMGILRVRNLQSPPYIYNQPFIRKQRVSYNDLFIVLASDGLFDFFTNDEVVKLVYSYIKENPFGDPAKNLVEQLVLRAAENAGFSIEELLSIPVGRRRKYHDDVTVLVIILGNGQRTSTASTTF